MARIFDVVEYPSEMLDEIVHRFPEAGVADLRIGSQIIVRESQPLNNGWFVSVANWATGAWYSSFKAYALCAS